MIPLATFTVDEYMWLPRHRSVAQRTGNCAKCGVRMYPDAKGERFKKRIRAAYIAAADDATPTHAPVAIHITASRPLPPSAPRRRDGEADTVKPDIDNVAKVFLDALNGLAFVDDSQVVDLRVVKLPRRIGVAPRIRCAISIVDDIGGLFGEGDV